MLGVNPLASQMGGAKPGIGDTGGIKLSATHETIIPLDVKCPLTRSAQVRSGACQPILRANPASA